MTEILLEGEKVVWSGKPVKASFVFSAVNAQILVVAFVTIAFSAVMMSMIFLVLGGSEPVLIFYLFAFWFVLLGIGNLLYPLVKQFLAHGKTRYVITDQRLIVEGAGIYRKTEVTKYAGGGVTIAPLSIKLSTEPLYLKDVDEAVVKIGFFDAFVGSGAVHVTSTGGVTSVLLAVKNPYEVLEVLQNAVRSTVIVCSGCGARIPPDAKVCPQCGRERV